MHNINSMMYAGETPWHGLGTYVGEHPVLSEDVCRLAGMDYTVEKWPLLAFNPNKGKEAVLVPDTYQTVRVPGNIPLGTVKEGYRVVQNEEAVSFLDSIAGSGKLLRYHTAGVLGKGERIWVLAEVVDLVIEPVKGDVSNVYLLLTKGHDGNWLLLIMWTSVRVVCQNTLNLAIGKGGERVKIRHTGKIQDKLDQARDILGMTRSRVETYQDIAKKLVKTDMTSKKLDEFLASLFPSPKEGKSATRAENKRAEIAELFESAPGNDLPGVPGTAWAALQAVTYYTTHTRTVRGGSGEKGAEKRLESSWFGKSNDINQKALSLLVSA